MSGDGGSGEARAFDRGRDRGCSLRHEFSFLVQYSEELLEKLENTMEMKENGGLSFHFGFLDLKRGSPTY